MKEISAMAQHSLIPELCSLAFLKYEMFQETYTGVGKSENALKIWNFKSRLNLQIIKFILLGMSKGLDSLQF